MAIDRSTQLGATAAPADASLNILVVDDESDLREMLSRSFAREGHRVTAVADGRAAIAASSAGVKCRLAVGAATAPASRAKMVW